MKNIDLSTTIIPFAFVLILCAFFVIAPITSTSIMSAVRTFLNDNLGVYYLITGLGVFIVSLWIAFSDIGAVKLGGADEKPQYGFFAWGAMIFTCGLAADILFYSLCEWIYYAQEAYIAKLGSIQEWTPVFSLFHWGLIPWSFYATLAACFGFMLHIRGVKKQKYSEACRPIFGDKIDGFTGRFIDILAVFALIAGTATTFSVATPLLSDAITGLVGIEPSKFLTISILIIICAVYTFSVMCGMKAVSGLANICMYIFLALLLYVLIFGGEMRFIIETGFASLGKMFQNFIELSTWTDPLRITQFPQNWTIFYWAYWMVWCVASPFFMGSISRGRTVRQIILGIYLFGVSSTLISFIILGNYGLGIYTAGIFDAINFYSASGNIYQTIIAIINTLPAPWLVFMLLIAAMTAFYATSFDSITLVASVYSYKNFEKIEKAGALMKLFWAVLLILLPIALVFSEESMNNLQTVSIIAAFPIAIVIILIIASFIKDAGQYAANISNQSGVSRN